MGLLKFLFIAITVLWLIRIVFRLLFPWIMRKVAQKVMGNARQQYQHPNAPYRNAHGRQPDGKIRIDYVPPQKQTKGARKAGEFVEFEEIKSSAE